MADLYKQQWDQMRRLPMQIDAAERKLAGLYKQARRYKMDAILTNQACVNDAWDREYAVAMVGLELRGGDE